MIKKHTPWLFAGLLVVMIWTWRSASIEIPAKSRAESSRRPRVAESNAEAPLPAEAKPAVVDPPIQQTKPGLTKIAAFRDWAKVYLNSSQQLRPAMLPEGANFAVAHTQEIAALIRKDPEQAIANAVPMVVRQDLPDSIVKLLENRVSMKASLNVYGNVPLPGAESSPDFEPYTHSVTTEDGSYWKAHVYGKRASQRTLTKASINGISVGNEMAVADSPLRQLEDGERPNIEGREVVEICPVSKKETVVERTDSGGLPAVTEATPAFETAERIVYVCSGGHISQVVEELSAEEEREHWAAQGAYLNAGAGSGSPIDPIGTIPGSTTTGQRSFLYIRATFPDHRIDPQSDAECQDSLRQMADYISQTSYGRCYFTYAVAPLVVLPYPESWYVQYQTDLGSADTLIQNQARTIAKEMGYDYLSYDLDAVRWNGAVGSYGGSASVGGRGMRLKSNAVGTFCHELGHNLGVWHANYWRTTPPSFIGPGNNLEYGNSFDVMGSSGSLGQYTAHFKNILNWLPTETYVTVNASGTYRIHQFDSSIADPSYRYALRIKKDAERDYWAEFRQRLTTNTGFTNGLMMTWDGWGLGNIGGSGGSPAIGSNKGAQLLDMTPGSFGNGITDTRNDSALWVGRTFSDDDAGIHVTPIAKNTTTVPPSMDVYVSIGDTPGNLAPALSINSSSTTPATNATITLTATASDPNGDPLAYAWVFNDGTYSTNNSPVQTKSWSTAGYYHVLCTASDMKGKRTTRSVVITVGTPATFKVSGTITGPDSLPLEGVYVANYAPSNTTSHPNSATFHGTWTDSDGNYTITGLTAGSYSITPTLYPYVFTASGFTNPVTVGPNTTGKNFSCTVLPTVTINVIDPVANEGPTPGTGTIRLERTGSTASALSVQIFNTNTGTATKTTDYTLSPAATASTTIEGGSGTSQYDIPAGAAFLDITVTPVNDSTAEGTEYAVLNFANTSAGYVLAGPAVAVVEIVDDENSTLPVVKLTCLDNIAAEAGTDTATLKVERNGSTAAALTVNLTPTGTATSGTDYTLPSSVIIPAGSASTTFTLTPVDDTAQEGTETAIITIATNAAYARDTLSNSQTVTLYDNDLPTITVVATDSNLTETPGNPGVFTITRTGGNPYQSLTVDYALAGRAVHGADYRRLDGRAVIPAGASATTVEIYPIDDSVDEGTQDVILQLRSTTTYAIGGTGTATMSITDNDNPQVYVKLTTSGVTEPASGSVTAVAFQIVRPVGGTVITVNYAISGTATSGVDFTALPGTIAFASADTSKTINVSALADVELEDTESVTLTLLPGTGYTLMTNQDPSATGYIVDGDQPTVDVSAADTASTLTTQGSETSASLRFIVSRDVSTTSDLIVNYTMAGTATEGVDYTGTTGSVTILSGATSAYVNIIPVNDTIAEGVESIIMNITAASGTYGLRTPSATLLLGDNDAFASGTAGFATAASTAAEDVGTHQVAVNITGAPVGEIDVNYRVSSGTATGNGEDFTLADGLLTFPPGTTTLNIPIPINPDVLPEPSETIVLTLYNAVGGNLGTSTHTVTITNQSVPEAFTDVATNLLTTSATLNGHVLPNALATDAWFQYGPTAAYGSTTTLQSIGSGTASVNVNASISGFAPGGYHFRCVSQNSMGITYGIDQIISSNNADLSNIATSTATLSPTFAASTLAYTATVPYVITSTTITPTVAQANATVKVNGTSVASGTPTAMIPLAIGSNAITIVVTAQDGTTTKTYTVNITRTPPSTNADLASLAVSTATLSPTFAATSLAYTSTVPNATTSITITPTVAQANANVKINGTPIASGSPSAAIPLASGDNSITILVAAQDSTTTKTYTLNITRTPLSTNADLASIDTSATTLTPIFDATTLSYTSTASNATTSITITPTVAQANATVKINGTPVASGSPSAAIPLASGDNSITILVTAQDSTTTKTYTLNITRTPLSTNADLASLAASATTLTPNFDATTLSYTSTVPNATTSITITPTVAQANATVKINGTPVASGSPSAAIPLASGDNSITILVTAQDGTTTRTYTATVTRTPLSTNADLASLAASATTLTPNFDATTLSYTSTVPNATTSITITPTVAQANATVKINGTPVASGSPSAAIPLASGDNSITILVTAQDGTTTRTYTVTVTREAVPFVQWQTLFFGTAENPNADPDADPDFDGIVNLMEYVLGGIPMGAGSSDTSILPTYSKTDTTFVFTYRRTKTVPLEFSTVIESSSTLSQNDWAPVANENITVQSIDTTTELVTATIPLGPTGSGLFVRLRVQANP